jgi:hypothetical protein
MSIAEKVGFVLLVAALLVQCTARPCFPRALWRLWAFGVAGIGGILAAQAYTLYAAWSGNELAHFFLPPHQPLWYFVRYVGERMLAPWGVSLLAAALAASVARWMNRRCGGRFFEPEEPLLIGLCFFLAGYPTFLLYLLVMFLAGAMASAFYELRGWGRAPLYYWWVPVALSAIILEQYIIPESVLNLFVL